VIYTRKSTEEGLQQEFNSLDARREASEAFVASQKNEGWQVIADHFDRGGYTGGNTDRPALKRLRQERAVAQKAEELTAQPAA
jgi:site-specific DNA recombinase